MVSRNNAGFVLALLIAIFVTSRAFAASVYFVGGSDDDGLGSSDFAQFPHDGFVLEHLQDLGHDVFYQSGNNSTTEFASNFDLLVISATLGSGSVRGKFHSVSTPILQWEEALMHVQAGNFPITVETGDANHGTDSRAREIVITNNAHFITQGFPLGPIEIAKLDADQDIAMPWAANIVEEVTSLATHPELTERHVLTAFEAGTEWADNTIAPMNMVNFPIQDHDFGNLNELGLLLFDNSIAWLLEVSGNPVPHNWDVDASGVWNEANNWSMGVVPDGVHEAVRFGGAITDDRNVSISRSVVVSLVEFDNANSYHINGPGSLTLQSDTGNATVVVRQGNHAINADMTFNSATDVTTAGGGLEFRGNLNLNGVTVNSAARAVLIGKSISGSGAFHGRVAAGFDSTVHATGNLAVGDSTAIDGFYSNGSIHANDNRLTLNDANDAVLDSAALVDLGRSASGELAASNGLTLDFGGNITGAGTINTPNDPAKPFTNNGNVVGTDSGIETTGFVRGVGTYDNVTHSGTFSPGFSPAVINAGSVSYDGTLVIEVGGASSGSGYDQLNHILGSGIANLGGSLVVELTNGFLPSLADTFEIITAIGGVNGTFASAQLPELGLLALDVRYGTDTVTLAVVPAMPGDFDVNGELGATDINLLTTEIRAGVNLFIYDLNEDSRVDSIDRNVWVHELKQTYFGDGNLDGEFNSGDLVAVFAAGEYEDNIAENSTWAEGDWNGDAEFESGDLVVAFADGGYEQGQRPVAAVPEPGSILMLMAGLISIVSVSRTRRNRKRV